MVLFHLEMENTESNMIFNRLMSFSAYSKRLYSFQSYTMHLKLQTSKYRYEAHGIKIGIQSFRIWEL